MNLYQRVATGNPTAAKEIIKNYGYEIRTNNLPYALKMLVKAEGEPALRSIVEIHPDKDLILECYKEELAPQKPDKHDDCECNKSKKDNSNKEYLNAVGQMTEAQKQAQLTNTFLVVSAVMILGALIIRHQ